MLKWEEEEEWSKRQGLMLILGWLGEEPRRGG